MGKKGKEKEKNFFFSPKRKTIPTGTTTTRELKASRKLELRTPTTTTAGSEHELLSATTTTSMLMMKEGTPIKGMLGVLFLAVGIVALVEAGFEFGVAEHFPGLVDAGHLLLRFLLADARLAYLVRVVLLREVAMRSADCALVRVSGHAEDFVVVFGLGAS